MKKRKLKRIALSVLSVFVLLIVVLCVHVYMVTRPRVDEHTRIMARIDIRQPIDQADVSKITAWLYRQKGVDHVVVYPRSETAIFTYAPMQNDASRITKGFKAALPYSKAERYMPSERELKSGCPVGPGSFAYTLYTTVKNIF
jgi:hypothetical protein